MTKKSHRRTPNIHFYLISIFISMLIINGWIHPLCADTDEGISWEARIDILETTGKTDYVLIGEALDANDGPPADLYDMPKAPTSPPPYIRIWGQDNLPTPYNQLLGDYRQYPDTMKQWNLSLLWYPSNPSDPPTNVTISWDILALSQSEYTTIELYASDNTIVADMLQVNTYTMVCPGFIPQHFTIRCSGSNSPPNTPSAPSGTTSGYHNAGYSYSTSAVDPDDDQLSYRFNWGDGTQSTWTTLYPSGTICTQTHTWPIPGDYTILVKARDSHNAESPWSEPFSITMLNRPPTSPTTPTPGNNSDQISTSPTLSWSCSDPDMDVLTYDIYLGTTADPPKIISRQASTAFKPSLDSLTLYYWRIVAYDDYGGITPGPLWQFSTKESDSSSSGGSGGGGIIENIPPVANASLSEHTGFVNSQMQFDGSQSYDTDGYITRWHWDFNDDHISTGEKTTHSFSETGEYLVTLTVTDDATATTQDTLLVTILTANTPPTTPLITGPAIGTINHSYQFNVTVDDSDNDTLETTIDWGDTTDTILADIHPGNTIEVNHSWNHAGPYTIEVRTHDAYTGSSPAEMIILINTIYFTNFGYILDQDNDGIYDDFMSLDGEKLMPLQKVTTTDYRLDIDGDTTWDYLLDTSSHEVTSYSPSQDTEDMWWLLPLIGIIIVGAIIAILFVVKRTGN